MWDTGDGREGGRGVWTMISKRVRVYWHGWSLHNKFERSIYGWGFGMRSASFSFSFWLAVWICRATRIHGGRRRDDLCSSRAAVLCSLDCAYVRHESRCGAGDLTRPTTSLYASRYPTTSKLDDNPQKQPTTRTSIHNSNRKPLKISFDTDCLATNNQ